MKKNIISYFKRVGLKLNKGEEEGYKSPGQVIVVGSQNGLLDEDLCWEIIENYPKQLILVGAKTEQLQRMEEEIKRIRPQLPIESIIFNKPLEECLDYLKNNYNPNLFIVGEQGNDVKYLA